MAVIFKCQEGIKQFSLQSVIDRSIAPSPVDDPIINQLKEPNIVGSCNGLVIILDANSSGDRLFLWNPSTRTFKILPQVDEINSHHLIVNHGVGWDESSDDYKVVAFFYMLKSREFIGKVYSSKTNSWKAIEHMRLSFEDPLNIVLKLHGLCFPLEREEGVFVGGKLHYWKKFGSEEPIACFDLKTEVCGKIELPFKEERAFSYSMMGAIGGCLSLVRVYKGSTKAEVWVMKEYGVKESWSKLVTLSNVQELVQRPFSAPFVAGGDGEIWLSFGRFLLVYYPKDNMFRAVMRFAREEIVFVKSLVSP